MLLMALLEQFKLIHHHHQKILLLFMMLSRFTIKKSHSFVVNTGRSPLLLQKNRNIRPPTPSSCKEQQRWSSSSSSSSSLWWSISDPSNDIINNDNKNNKNNKSNRNRNDHQDDVDDMLCNNDDNLLKIQSKITKLNDGIPINVRSQKQVSMAIYGTTQHRTTKSELRKVAFSSQTTSTSLSSTTANDVNVNDDNKENYYYSPQQQQLAMYILEERERLKQEKQGQKNGRQQRQQQQHVEELVADTSSSPHTNKNDEHSSITSLHRNVRTAPSLSREENFIVKVNEAELPSPITSETTNNINQSNKRSRPKSKQPKTKTHEQIVEDLFASSSSMIDPCWKEPLLKLSRPSSRKLVTQLDSTDCPMGYSTAKKGTFVAYCQEQKLQYPNCVLLVRCGDFYETYGLDAILLVEHAGMNPMGQKAKAGCPKMNIQQTVDCLVAEGFSVAIFEEIGDSYSTTKSTSSNLKVRMLSQIVSPASPTYLYDMNFLVGSTDGDGDNMSMCLDGLPPPRPYIGIVETSAGYSLIEVSMEEQSITYSERLTKEAVTCRLTAYPPADPVVYIPASTGSNGETITPSFIKNSASSTTTRSSSTSSTTTEFVESTLGGYRLRTKILQPHLIQSPKPGLSDADRYIEAVVDTFIRLNERRQEKISNIHDDEEEDGMSKKYHQHHSPTVDDFTISMKKTKSFTNPLYVTTAQELGLVNDRHRNGDSNVIPALTSHILDSTAPAVTRRFLHRYLLVPPPPEISNAMSTIVKFLFHNDNMSLPPMTVPPLGKVLSFIRAGQASAAVYGELLQSLSTTRHVLLMEEEEYDYDHDGTSKTMIENFVDALLVMCAHESGLATNGPGIDNGGVTKESLLDRCHDAIVAMEDVISPLYHVLNDDHENGIATSLPDMVSTDPFIPSEYLERNESPWRGRVKPEVAKEAYDRVECAVHELSQAVKEDFIIGDDENDFDSDKKTIKSNQALIVQDISNNIFALKQIPSNSNGKEDGYYYHPRDRKGKTLRTRYTTVKVQEALSEYVAACDAARENVSAVLAELAETLQENGHMPAIVQSAHLNLILSAAFHHALKATQKNWDMATVIEPSQHDDDDYKSIDESASLSPSAHFVEVWPYWMDKSQAVSNTFDLDGMFLLTAPNMSGKSTLMRSTAAAALLSCCGLCAPIGKGSTIPRFDTLFLRGASADVPAENKSAFGAEMEDISALMRCCGSNSLVFVDELGRGTSPSDGTRLAGAVLEAMAQRGMKGIFATHLHDIFQLPLERKDRIRAKRMAIEVEEEGSMRKDPTAYEWTFRLEDGVCTDSLALVTAVIFGLPDEIIRRAEELEAFLPERIQTSGIQHEHTIKEFGVGTDNEVLNGISSSFEEEEASLPLSAGHNGVNHKYDPENLQRAVSMLEELTGKSSVPIPPRWSPPAALENKSCVYIIELPLQPPRYYVGETDSLGQRLTQHRRKGLHWKQAKAVALAVPSKTDARAFESLFIRALSQSGFKLESTADGRTVRRFQTPLDRTSSTS